jgi:hypothetical protein
MMDQQLRQRLASQMSRGEVILLPVLVFSFGIQP